MFQVNNVRLLKRKLAAVKRNLTNARTRNKQLTLALEYYASRRNHLGWLAPGVHVAKEALRD